SGNPREARFGVPHRRGRIAIDRAKIALAIDQRITHAERLRHADERIVNRGIAVRVKLAENFADDLGALAGGAIGRKTHLVHAIENAAMNGFQAVANIGKGASHDYAHGVIEVRTLHFVFDIDGQEIVAAGAAWKRHLRRRGRTLWGIILVSHELCGKSYFSRYLALTRRVSGGEDGDGSRGPCIPRSQSLR